jgi:hypothetical protein
MEELVLGIRKEQYSEVPQESLLVAPLLKDTSAGRIVLLHPLFGSFSPPNTPHPPPSLASLKITIFGHQYLKQTFL